MRNVMKPAAATASSRARRSVRGVAAVVASLALAAGLGSYPVDAQETATITTTSSAAVSDAVTVDRSGNVDHITIRDTDDNPWDSGRKASDEYIWGVKREGSGEITRINKVVADGVELEPEFYGFVNGKDFGVIGIDEDALSTLPPLELKIEVETTGSGTYSIAESDEVPTAAELSRTGYGINPDAAATVNPTGVGKARATAETKWSDEVQLSSPIVGTGKERFPNIGTDPYFEVRPTGELPNQVGPDIRITRIVVRNTENNGHKADDEAMILKNGGTEQHYFKNPTRIRDDRNRVKGFEATFFNPKTGDSPVSGEFIIYSGQDSLKIGVDGVDGWTDDLDVLRSRYVVEVYGSFRVPANTSTEPSPTATDAPPTTTSNNPPKPTTPADEVAANFRLEGEGVLVKDLGVTGENPFVSTGEFLQDSHFERAYVRVGAPNSPLAIERYGVTIDKIEDGVKLEKRVISATADEVVYEVFPVSTETGERLPSAKVPKGAKIEATVKYPSRPRTVESTVTVFGSPVENAPKPTVPGEAPKGKLISSTYPNPPMPKKCGLKIAIVADLSTSLKYADSDGFEASKNAAKQLAKSLQGTPTEVGIYSFADRAANNSGGPQPVDGPNGELNPKITSAIDSWRSGALGGATNWEAALKQVQDNKYDVVYFITDGMPTSDNSNWQNSLIEKDRNGFNFGAFVQETSLNRAVIAADELKSQGTRIVPLMVDLRLGKNREFVVERDYVLKNLKTFEETEAGQYSFFAASGNQAGLGSTARYPNSETLVNVEEALNKSTTDIKLFRFLQNRKDGRETNGKYRDVNANSAHYLDAKWGIENLTHGLRTVKSMGEDISGPNDTVRLNSYGQLTGELRALGEEISQLCEGKVIVKKRIVDGSGNPLHNNVKDWEFSISSDAPVIGLPDGRTRFADKQLTSVKAEGEVAEGNVPDDQANVVWPIHSERPVEVAIAETQQDPYHLHQHDGKNAVCTQKLKGKDAEAAVVENDGETGFKVAIPATEDGHLATVTCTVSNTKETEEKVRLQLQKVDASDNTVSLTGAGFTLSWEEQDGTPKSIPLTEEQGSAGKYVTEKVLEPGRTYVLTETRAPKAADGVQYSLLTQPVTLRFVSTEQGLVPEFQGSNGDWDRGQPTLPIVSASIDKDKTSMVLTLANVRQGNMPKTGGIGLQLPILLGGALIAAGALVGRRKVAA